MLFIYLLCSCTSEEEKIEYPTTMLSENGIYEVSYTSTPSPIPLNEDFSITMTISDPTDQMVITEALTVDIDAEMPTHDHGMPQSPDTSDLGNGQFRADGMFFQMPGYWHISAWITNANGDFDKTTFEFDCCL